MQRAESDLISACLMRFMQLRRLRPEPRPLNVLVPQGPTKYCKVLTRGFGLPSRPRLGGSCIACLLRNLACLAGSRGGPYQMSFQIRSCSRSESFHEHISVADTDLRILCECCYLAGSNS